MALRTKLDVGRLSAAVSRPGIDPRLWLTLATVKDVAYDAEFGMYADVQFLPEGDFQTCYIGSEYAGDDFGMFFPPKVDDIVLVAVPEGQPGNGCVLIKRLWHATAKPPAEMGDSTTPEETDASSDPVLVVEANRTLKIIARGGANVRLEVADAGKVQIAATGAAQIEVTGESAIIVNSPDVRIGDTAGNPIARVGDIVAGMLPSMTTVAGPVTAVPTTPGTIAFVGQIASGKQTVKA
jgi:hypothetical protein